eukprot:COSAG02_NODE_33492_length_499_cov_0.775000_1_plen_57_part_10
MELRGAAIVRLGQAQLSISALAAAGEHPQRPCVTLGGAAHPLLVLAGDQGLQPTIPQ